MNPDEIQKLRSLTSFDALVDYLRDELDWPIEAEDAEKITFPYKAEELGLDPTQVVKVESIRQMRPLAEGQPWGVFYIEFESKKLPVVLLRRILHALVPSSRRQDPDRPAWKMSDLLFISSQGTASERSISFAHFRQEAQGKPELRTFSWDVHETHLYYIDKLNLAALRWPQDEENANAWREQWRAAFTIEHGYVPRTAQALAEQMARIAKDIRQAVEDLYSLEHAGGPLHQLHLSLKLSLITDLEAGDFADMYAQTVTYGLFAARATHQGPFAGGNVAALIAHTNPFLRELLEQMTEQQALELDELGVDELSDLLRQVDMEAILRDFGRQKRGEDPVIHFYETFMQQYDPQQKTKRGEFYTPDPVVSFIVRSVDHLLRTEFDYPDGLADSGTMPWKGQQAPRVQVLDPATGTGTFLKYVIQVVWESFYNKTRKLSAAERRARWNQYVRERLLPRLHGFELKMAPYTIAHMKLGLALQEKGFDFQEGERLQVYLSNALQPAHEVARVDTPALAHEAEQANQVKTGNPVTVVIGNPPYAGHSSNASRNAQGEWNFIGQLLQDYYRVDGQPLGEKNPKWLQDDYVKFLRFGQWCIEQSGAGILAMITNHSYLDNPTFRGMRQSLMYTFSEIYVLDLHGNSKKKETAPDGSKDENVFDIQQGVAICLMVRRPGVTRLARVYRADLYGLREFKYEWLITHHRDTGSVEWQELWSQQPYYLFTKQNLDLRREYEQGWKITEIMPLNLLGFQTHRDPVAVSFDPESLYKQVEKYLDRKPSKTEWQEFCQKCDYRPFDKRFVYLGKNVCDRPRLDVESHLFMPNLALNMMRQTKANVWRHVLVSSSPTPAVFIEIKDGSSVFPLYLYSSPRNPRQGTLFDEPMGYENSERVPNISGSFVSVLQKNFGLRFVSNQSDGLYDALEPEDVLYYSYAIFHSPAYRERYAEFLKIDFPRLPLTSNLLLFRDLCRLGGELVGLHLLESPLLDQPITHFTGQGDKVVAKGHPKYSQGRVWINPQQGFEGVPAEVWEFHIGGYQVCHKWLKDRRGRRLSDEDVEHYQKVVVALKETMRLMGEIDDVIEGRGEWPIR
ncbi:MAG: type ISP restriction/modification enzyme [Chloroflexota bacterium]